MRQYSFLRHDLNWDFKANVIFTFGRFEGPFSSHFTLRQNILNKYLDFISEFDPQFCQDFLSTYIGIKSFDRHEKIVLEFLVFCYGTISPRQILTIIEMVGLLSLLNAL